VQHAQSAELRAMPAPITDRGSIVIPEEVFPEGKGNPIPIFVPPVTNSSNVEIKDNWKTAVELKGQEVNKWATGLAGVEIFKGIAGTGKGDPAKAQQLLDVKTDYKITIQESPQGERRAIIQTSGVDRTIQRIAETIDSSKIIKKEEGRTIEILKLDRSHSNDPYIAYVSLSPDKKTIDITPKIYPEDKVILRTFGTFSKTLGVLLGKYEDTEITGESLINYLTPLFKTGIDIGLLEKMFSDENVISSMSIARMDTKAALKEQIKDKVEQITEKVKEKAEKGINEIKKQLNELLIKSANNQIVQDILLTSPGVKAAQFGWQGLLPIPLTKEEAEAQKRLIIKAIEVACAFYHDCISFDLSMFDPSKHAQRNAQQQLTPVKVTFTQTFNGLYTQTPIAPSSQAADFTVNITSGTRGPLEVREVRPGNFTGLLQGRVTAYPGDMPGTYNNDPVIGWSVGTVEAKGFKEGPLKGEMQVQGIHHGVLSILPKGPVTINTDGSLSHTFNGVVIENGVNWGTANGTLNQTKTTP
jgi:hypothetical protein